MMTRSAAVRLLAAGAAGASIGRAGLAGEPALSCELQLPSTPAAGLRVLFVLTSHRDGTRIFADWNSWGYYMRSFTAVANEASATRYSIVRRPRGWDKNAPTTLTLDRGKTLTTAFDLADGTWSIQPELKLTPNSSLLVTPRFYITQTWRLSVPGLWTGEIEGPAVRVAFGRAALDALNAS